MAAWSCLPPEIKRHIVKKLDFMGRHALRNTCHLEREIVDSTICKLPRVRFGYKEGKCLIVIYTGIDQFLRLEFSSYEDGVFVERSENSCNLPLFDTVLISTSSDPLEFACTVLKNLLAHDDIQIQTMEWDIPKQFGADSTHLKPILFGHLTGAKFHVKEMVSLLNTVNFIEELYPEICYWDELETIRDFSISPSDKSITPVIALDNSAVIDGKVNVKTTICLEESELLLQEAANYFRTLSSLAGHNEYRFEATRDTVTRGKGPKALRKANAKDDTIAFHGSSECGIWNFRTFKENEQRLRPGFEAQECGIGNLCSKCADPFEYWYHQNLPRRLILEPFWSDVIIENMPFLEDMMRNQIKKMRKMMRSEEKIDIPEPLVASWGFRRLEKLDSDDPEDVASSDESEVIEENGNLGEAARMILNMLRDEMQPGGIFNPDGNADPYIAGAPDRIAQSILSLGIDINAPVAREDVLPEDDEGSESDDVKILGSKTTVIRKILVFTIAFFIPILVSFMCYYFFEIFFY